MENVFCLQNTNFIFLHYFCWKQFLLVPALINIHEYKLDIRKEMHSSWCEVTAMLADFNSLCRRILVKFRSINSHGNPFRDLFINVQMAGTIHLHRNKKSTTFFWIVKPYTSVEVHRRFGRTYRLHFHGRSVSRKINQQLSDEPPNYTTLRPRPCSSELPL
jgi:hypothetical protein